MAKYVYNAARAKKKKKRKSVSEQIIDPNVQEFLTRAPGEERAS